MSEDELSKGQPAVSARQEEESALITIRVFISYSWADHNRDTTIGVLAVGLEEESQKEENKKKGDCEIKVISDRQFPNKTSPKEGWTTWMRRSIEEADIVLCICGENYYNASEKKGGGLGSSWETALIGNNVYDSAGLNYKFSVVLPAARIFQFVPAALKQWATDLPLITEKGLNTLEIYNHIQSRYKSQPKDKPPPPQSNHSTFPTNAENDNRLPPEPLPPVVQNNTPPLLSDTLPATEPSGEKTHEPAPAILETTDKTQPSLSSTPPTPSLPEAESSHPLPTDSPKEKTAWGTLAVLLCILGITFAVWFLFVRPPGNFSDKEKTTPEEKTETIAMPSPAKASGDSSENETMAQVAEKDVIAFVPSGTLLIKTIAGEEFRAILNTVSGFPVSFFKEGTKYELALEDFSRAEFKVVPGENDYTDTLTILTYDDKNKETVFIRDYEFYYSESPPISFLSDKGMRFLSLNQVERITKDKNKTPSMPKNIRHVYIRSGGMVYKVPQSLMKYENIAGGYMPSSYFYYGILHAGDDVFSTNTLKYIRIHRKMDGFRRTHNSLFANVYFEDNSMLSTSLACGSYYHSFIVAPTALGVIRPIVFNVDEIFFGSYDVDFAKKVSVDAWDGSKVILFAGKGTATVYKTDGTKWVFASNSLVAVGAVGRRTSSYPTAYLKTEEGGKLKSKSRADTPALFFSDLKSLKVKKSDNGFMADYLLYSGETGEKMIWDSRLEGLTENGKGSIQWEEIEKIDFDRNRNVDLSRIKKAIVIDKNGSVYETMQPMLYVRYVYTSNGIPYSGNEQTVKVEGGLSIAYDTIKKIELLPPKQEGEQTRYPAKFTWRAGASQELMLDIGGYYNTNLQFLTPMGVFSLALREEVQSIEFL